MFGWDNQKKQGKNPSWSQLYTSVKLREHYFEYNRHLKKVVGFSCQNIKTVTNKIRITVEID